MDSPTCRLESVCCRTKEGLVIMQPWSELQMKLLGALKMEGELTCTSQGPVCPVTSHAQAAALPELGKGED
jgi:hypothetical protein